ncbi:hypothetical protein EKO04_001733 [Ascochyta lentis]|uniref:Carrier domain-containing protein n=1 Tax=Ascochyta lentis TaxID=205686 RepID=A0A8H7JCY0_9PLEO|nr:hypothetical protein EKO04_001733 [Ascochyta lentis]
MVTPKDLTQIWQLNELVPASVDKCVDVIIQESVSKQPNSPAVCAWDGVLTYGELDQFATALAVWLVHLGVGPNNNPIVPLCFEKSRWTAVSILGVLKAGAAFVLIDPYQPEHRLRIIIEQVGADLIVSSVKMSELSSRLAPRSIVVSSHLLGGSLNSLGLIRFTQDPSSIAYVAFTSGSTGEPKGAIISHRNIASALYHQQQRMAFTTKTRFYDFSSYSFDASIGIFFTTLSSGGCICVPSEDDRRNNLIQSIVSLEANTVDLTPSVASLLSPDSVPSIKTLILGGEALQARDLSRWWSSVRVMSFYGPCECTPTSTINYDAKTPEEAIHLGKGAGLITWITDPDNHHSLVPFGAVGELLLEGPLVGLGYLHDPERTAASFIEDPVWLLAGAVDREGRHGRLYKTGDLVRYHDDGSLIFVSRKDTQIKIRGQRIELGEIESVLRGNPGVDGAVAVLHKDQDIGSEWITAFVTLRNREIAYQGLFPIQQWERLLMGKSIPTKDGGYALSRRLFPGRDFTKWALMYSVNDTDMKQVGGWITSMIDPMADNVKNVYPLERWNDSGVVLFSLPTAASSNDKIRTEHVGAVKFISKIIDSTPAVGKTATVFKAIPEDLGPQCRAISSGLVVLSSVVHLFPSLAYLHNVIREASELCGVKTIVFGHIHSSISYQESLAEGALRHFGGIISHSEIRSIANVGLDTSELLVNPDFFTNLPEKFPGKIVHVEIVPNEDDAEGKLGPFCYTAVIHVSSEDTQLEVRQVSQADWIDFEVQRFDRQALLSLLQTKSPSTIVPVTNIPYSRSVGGMCVLQLLQDGGEEVNLTSDWMSHVRIPEHKNSLCVRDLVELSRYTSRRVEVSWALQSSQRGALTAIFYHDPPTEDRIRVLFQFPLPVDLNNSIGFLGSQPKQRNMSEQVENELLEMVRTRLPSYMVPRVIKVIDRMPLNNNGKIDRKALERNTQRKSRQDTPNSDDRTLSVFENQVRQIWGDILCIEPTTIGRNDRFFDIGGDSITAMRVVLETRKHSLAITVRDVFLLEVHEMANRFSSR